MTSRAERATSFGAIAAEYDRLRPGPPAAAVDWLLAWSPSVSEPRRVAGPSPAVIDLGAGTGLLSRPLAARVPHVIAVEPDERMRAVLRARSPGVRVVGGTGEAIPLPDASADGVFVGSAWHWMDPGRAIPEIGRVLRDCGRFGAIWTGSDRHSGWLAELNMFGEVDRLRDRDGGSGSRPRFRHREVTLSGHELFGRAETESFPFIRSMTVTDFIDMLGTYSGVITASPHERAAVLARARAMLAQRFPGAAEVAVPMRSHTWRADRMTRPG